MNRGAVAMVDALGFRGIWADPQKPSLAALDTLKAVRTAVDLEAKTLREQLQLKYFPKPFRNLVKAPEIAFRFLSDTVVIAAFRKPRSRAPRTVHETAAVAETGMSLARRDDAIDALMRYVACRCACVAIQAAAIAEKPLAYRGVVSVGALQLRKTS